MIQQPWQAFAPGLAMSVALIGSSGLLAMGGMRSTRFAHALGPVQMFTLSSVCILGLLLNANAWLPGYIVFYGLLGSGSVGLVLALRRGTRDPLSHAVLWTCCAALLVSTLVVAAWEFAFASRLLWMLEGTNHDLVFFYGGAKWVMQHPFSVDQAAVVQEWALGKCGEGMQFIGNGCSVQRNGAYTLLGLASSFFPDAGPNQVRAMIGAMGVFPVLGMLPALSGRFGSARWPRGGWVCITLALLCMGCTGMLLSVVNENIGTGVASTILMMIVLWGLTPMRSMAAKWVMLGAAAGCAAIVYGEAAVYACALVALAVTVSARSNRSWRMFIVGGLLAMAVFALLLNRMLPGLLTSYVQISGVVSNSEWPSWYIQQRFFGFWLAAPFAGLLLTAQPAVNPEAVTLGLLLMLATGILAAREKRWRYFTGLVLLSAVFVFYVQNSGYQYGEHKLVQMLGPTWVALLAWLLARHSRRRGGGRVMLLLAGVLAALSVAYAMRARPIIVSHADSSISYELAAALKLPVSGDEVIIDSSAVSGPAQYVKQDFSILELHRRGVRVRMSDNGRPQVGYSDAMFQGTLAKADSPDWLLVFKRPGTGPALSMSLKPVHEDASFALYSLQQARLPLALAGKGWYECEQGHCWTAGEFTLEVMVPAQCSSARLHTDLGLFAPPADAKIQVQINGQPGNQVLASDLRGEISVELPIGRSIIALKPDWQVSSPQAEGQSADARALFANVSNARISCDVSTP